MLINGIPVSPIEFARALAFALKAMEENAYIYLEVNTHYLSRSRDVTMFYESPDHWGHTINLTTGAEEYFTDGSEDNYYQE